MLSTGNSNTGESSRVSMSQRSRDIHDMQSRSSESRRPWLLCNAPLACRFYRLTRRVPMLRM